MVLFWGDQKIKEEINWVNLNINTYKKQWTIYINSVKIDTDFEAK